jgi:hypothetical protein
VPIDPNKKYRVVNGIDSGGKRFEPGDMIATKDLGKGGSLEWLVEQGHVVDPESAIDSNAEEVK